MMSLCVNEATGLCIAVQYEPKVDPRLAHHMLIFGCKYPPRKGSW